MFVELDILLKKVEIESLIKSFLLFFISQMIFLSILFGVEYNKEKHILKEKIFNEMRVCSYNLQCKKFQIDFSKKGAFELYKLFQKNGELSSYFPISQSSKYILKIYLKKEHYLQEQKKIQKKLLFQFFQLSLILVLLSILFAFYTLSPLRNALKMTEEFIKDILHDFNTPLSVMRLNTSLLKNDCKDNKKIQRIENAMQNILNLQANLKAYLMEHHLQQETIFLKPFLQERIALIDKKYSDIHFIIDINKDINITINKNAFGRIIDNLLSNGAKYNKPNGEVKITLQNTHLIISDTGKGIKNPHKIFDRFYKEQDRGIGIGLHIVKKLCEELQIKISVQSDVDKGSRFSLDLKKYLS